MQVTKQRIRKLKWLEDDCGVYWTAEEVDYLGRQTAVTGSYYSLTGERSRAPREEQEKEIAELFEVVEEGERADG